MREQERRTDAFLLPRGRAALDFTRQRGYDMVFLDTAGRLHVDEELMNELKSMKATVKPDEIMLVVDAMTGQDAVNAAQSFNEWLDIDSVMLSKLDGDARGGAALSVRAITGKPIKFSGIGEKLEDIEAFHPDRMASRILGMGDVLTLIEKAERAYDAKSCGGLAGRHPRNPSAPGHGAGRMAASAPGSGAGLGTNRKGEEQCLIF